MEREDKETIVAQSIPESLAESASFLLARSARILEAMNERALSPLKMAPRELALLRILSSEGPMTQQAIGKKHRIDRTTIVQIVDALESRDLVTRVPNQCDRRSNLLYITPRGKKTITQAVRLIDKQQQEFLAPLAPVEWENLRSALTRLIIYHMPPGRS